MLLFDFQKKKAISGKIKFFVIDQVCNPQFVCLNIGFRVISFVIRLVRCKLQYFQGGNSFF